MNLRLIHAVVILFSAALALVFGLWCLSRYEEAGGSAFLTSAVGAFATSLALGAYDRWFLRRTRMLR